MTNDTRPTHKVPSESTIQKIQKLLALAGNNPNEHERIEAMRRASEMLAEHNLAMSDVQITGATEAEKATYEELCSTKNFRGWQSILLEGLTRLNYCKSMKDMRKDLVIIVGTPTAMATVRSLYTWLAQKIESEAKARYTSATERTAFLIGAAGEIQVAALERLKQEQRDAAAETVRERHAASAGYATEQRSNALVRVRNNADADNRRVMQEDLGVRDLKAGEAARPQNTDAFSEGRSYGRQVNLDKQISDSSSTRRLK